MRIGEAAFTLDIDELKQIIKGESGNLLDGGELLNDGSAGRAKDIGSAAVFVALMLVLIVWGLILLPSVL